MKDYYYKGIHYAEYHNSFDRKPMVRLTASDFKLMIRYIRHLEVEIFNLTGEDFKPLVDNDEEDFAEEEDGYE